MLMTHLGYLYCDRCARVHQIERGPKGEHIHNDNKPHGDEPCDLCGNPAGTDDEE